MKGNLMATTSRKTALITGAHRGLGRDCARQLAERGYRVLAGVRRESDGVELVRELERRGASADWVLLDVTVRAHRDALVQTMRDAGSGLDVLINNAGVSLDGFNPQVVQNTLAVNYFGAKHVTEAVREFLLPGAAVVMVSSGLGALSALSPELRSRFLAPDLTVGGLEGLLSEFADAVSRRQHRREGWPESAYGVSKMALNAWVRIESGAYRAAGFRLNAVCPGWVKTDMGGAGAPRSLAVGAASILWPGLPEHLVHGGFYRDGRPLDWTKG